MTTSTQLGLLITLSLVLLVPVLALTGALVTLFLRWAFCSRGPAGWSRHIVKVDGFYIVLLAPTKETIG